MANDEAATRFRDLRRTLRARVDGSAEDLATIDEALEYAARYARIAPHYFAALDAYYEPEAPTKAPRRERLANAVTALLGDPLAPADEIAEDYVALTTDGGMRDPDSAVYALYGWRSWQNLLDQRPSLAEDAQRGSPSIGHDLGLRDAWRNPASKIEFPLRPMEAVAAITAAREFPSMEACLQALKRAKTRGKIPATVKLPSTWERI